MIVNKDGQAPCTTQSAPAFDSSATAVFGGFTPAIATYLIHATGNRAIPGLWLSFAAACGLIATALLNPSRVARYSAIHEHGP